MLTHSNNNKFKLKVGAIVIPDKGSFCGNKLFALAFINLLIYNSKGKLIYWAVNWGRWVCTLVGNAFNGHELDTEL